MLRSQGAGRLLQLGLRHAAASQGAAGGEGLAWGASLQQQR